MTVRPLIAVFGRTLLLVSLLLSAGCLHSGARSSPAPRIVAYGDSITRGYRVPEGAGWVELLAARLKTSDTPIPVFNAGGNGNTSREGLARIETDVLAHLPGLVLVEFGGNDAVEGARNVTVDDFERNLLAIERAVTARGGRVALLTFPPIIDEWHVHGRNAYFLARGGLDHEVERYRQRTREVAARLGVPLFDLDHFLRERMQRDGPAKHIAPDGVHLTPEGNRVVAEAIEQFLVREKWLPARG